jgi:hypothetical protein
MKTIKNIRLMIILIIYLIAVKPLEVWLNDGEKFDRSDPTNGILILYVIPWLLVVTYIVIIVFIIHLFNMKSVY